MGLSDKPGDAQYRYTLASRIDELEALYQHLVAHHGLPTTGLTLAVHDWGGMIGFGWAVRHPERIARLVVTNTAAFPLPKGQRLPAALRLGRDSALGALLIRGFNAFAAGATRHATVRPLPPEVRRAYTAPYDSWANRIATLRFVQDIPLGPGDAAWEIVDATARELHVLADKPMLIAWGLRDFVFDRAFHDEFRAASRTPRTTPTTTPATTCSRTPTSASCPWFAPSSPPRQRRDPHPSRREPALVGARSARDRRPGLAQTVSVATGRVAIARRARSYNGRCEATMTTTPNIADALRDRAREAPARTALVLPDGHAMSYAALDLAADELAAGLVAIGIGPGVRTVLMVRPGEALFTLMFALFRARAVPVLVDPGHRPARVAAVPGRGAAAGLHRHPARARGARAAGLGSRQRAHAGHRGAALVLGRPYARAGAGARLPTRPRCPCRSALCARPHRSRSP